MDINFEYYKVFYFVAKYGNVTKAAAALGSSQPNVTRVMKLLEAQLNCKLFVRRARGVSLTREGERLRAHVEIAYSQLLNAQEELLWKDSLQRGAVDIGATETALYLFLLSELRGFKRDYPAVRIRIHNHSTPETVRQLLGGKLDFAVITTPFQLPKHVTAETALAFREILVGGAQYRESGGFFLKLADLKKYPWVGLGRESATYEMYRDFFIRQNVDFAPETEVATSGLMLPLIEHGFGIGFVPEALALPLLKEGRLVRIGLDIELPERKIQIISDRERGKSLAADACYEYLRGKRLMQENEAKTGGSRTKSGEKRTDAEIRLR